MAWVAERSPRVHITGCGNLASQALHKRLGFTEMPGTWIPPAGWAGDARSQQFYCAELHGITCKARKQKASAACMAVLF
jgi:hypothetical protein